MASSNRRFTNSMDKIENLNVPHPTSWKSTGYKSPGTFYFDCEICSNLLI